MIEDLLNGDVVVSEFIVLESFDVNRVDGFEELFLELGAELFGIGPDAEGFFVGGASCWLRRRRRQGSGGCWDVLGIGS